MTLMLCIISSAHQSLVCHLWWNVYSNLLPIYLKLSWVSSCWTLYISWLQVLDQIFTNIFSPANGLPFYFPGGDFWSSNLKNVHAHLWGVYVLTCIPTCIGASMCECECTCVCIHNSMWKLEIDFGGPAQSCSSLFTEAESLTEPGAVLASQAALGLQIGRRVYLDFTWVLSSELWSTHLYSKHFILSAISPVQSFY